MSPQKTSLTGIVFYPAMLLQLLLLLGAALGWGRAGPDGEFLPPLLAAAAGVVSIVALRAYEQVSARRRTLLFWISALLLRLTALPMLDEGKFTVGGLLGILVFDLVILFFLLRINTGGRRRHRDTAWYAWNPLVVLGFWGGAFEAAPALACMVAALWAAFRANPMNLRPPAWSWSISAVAMASLATALAPVAWAILPALALALRVHCWLLVPAIGVVLWLVGLPAIPENGGGLILGWIPVLPWWVGWTLTGLLSSLWLWRFRRDWSRAGLYIMATTLLLAADFQPWQVLFILPLACWRKSLPWFVASISSFALLLPLPAGPAHLLAILPFLLVLLRRRWRKFWV